LELIREAEIGWARQILAGKARRKVTKDEIETTSE